MPWYIQIRPIFGARHSHGCFSRPSLCWADLECWQIRMEFHFVNVSNVQYRRMCYPSATDIKCEQNLIKHQTKSNSCLNPEVRSLHDAKIIAFFRLCGSNSGHLLYSDLMSFDSRLFKMLWYGLRSPNLATGLI